MERKATCCKTRKTGIPTNQTSKVKITSVNPPDQQLPTMKYIAPSLLMALLICSCANEDVKTAEADNIKPYNVDSIRQVFNPVINGIWLAEEYYQALEKTKSPFKAYEKAGLITGLLIEKQGGDSLSISVNNGNHEGTTFIAWYRPGHTVNALPLNL